MAEGKIWTADELLALTPNERYEIIKAGSVTDLKEVPPESLVERVRADIREHIAATEATTRGET